MSDPMPRPPRPPLTTPRPDRLDPGRSDYHLVLGRHDAAVARGEDTYVDPSTGLLVMTAQALWDRGRCCDTGCRHCPYPGAED